MSRNIDDARQGVKRSRQNEEIQNVYWRRKREFEQLRDAYRLVISDYLELHNV